MKNKNWFWGPFFLLSAVFVIASQVGSFVEIGFLSILATVLLVALIVYSLFNLNYFGIFVPSAFLYTIYVKPLELPEVSIWLLLFAAVLASIGFSILFRRRPKKCIHVQSDYNRGFRQSTESTDDNNPYAKVSFGSSSKYLHSDNLQSGQFIVSFGELEVFFDQANIHPDGAEVFIDCSFGALKLYIPKHWNVIDNLNTNLGGVENNARFACPSENAPKLTLSGNVQLGGVEIQYI